MIVPKNGPSGWLAISSHRLAEMHAQEITQSVGCGEEMSTVMERNDF